MTVYVDVVMLLNFCVDFLLLLGANRLCGHPSRPGRCALAAVFGAGYAGCCLLPGFSFLSRLPWPPVFLILMVWIGYGWQKNAWKRGILFVFLSMALGGIAMLAGARGFWGILAAALGVLLLCVVGFSQHRAAARIVRVELWTEGRTLKLMALHDTGNQLQDPITGQPVMVAGADVAQSLLGLTEEELEDPAKTLMEFRIPKMQLIPYHSVGKNQGLLLAVKMDKVTVDGVPWGRLVAFAPKKFSSGSEYQALVGGNV